MSAYLALENISDVQPARIALDSWTILASLADQTLQPPLVSDVTTCHVLSSRTVGGLVIPSYVGPLLLE